jgi:hypothetical protein
MFRPTFPALGCVLASALASTAAAQLLNRKDLSSPIAITIAKTGIETCKANGYAVSATVVSRTLEGEFLDLMRQGALG